ncbi:acyltransferase family protein [Macrococcus animalis]|uniref:acyltransferase family protein n=1 Tax=Macrococcus animalis TaxID=3395467 RepID=UPI0039BE0117
MEDVLVKKKRIEWIDIAKGICIFLVVWGHSGDNPFGMVMSWFRIPLFFFLSGILFKPVAVEIYDRFFYYKFVKMIVPYISYGIVVSVLFNIGYPTRMYQYFVRVLIGGHRLDGPAGVFWFITVLLCTQLLFGYLSRYKYRTQIIVLTILYLIGHLIAMSDVDDVHVPWHLNAVTGAVCYYALGYYLKSFLQNNIKNWNAILLSLFVVGGMIFYTSYFDYIYMINLKTNVFHHIILDLIVPLCSAFLVCTFSNFLNSFNFSKIISWIGQNSITIMYLHLPFNIFVWNFYKHNSVLIFILVGMIFPLLVGWILKKNKYTKHIFISPDIDKKY